MERSVASVRALATNAVIRTFRNRMWLVHTLPTLVGIFCCTRKTARRDFSPYVAVYLTHPLTRIPVNENRASEIDIPLTHVSDN